LATRITVEALVYLNYLGIGFSKGGRHVIPIPSLSFEFAGRALHHFNGSEASGLKQMHAGQGVLEAYLTDALVCRFRHLSNARTGFVFAVRSQVDRQISAGENEHRCDLTFAFCCVRRNAQR
jgi:hypothetical protein